MHRTLTALAAVLVVSACVDPARERAADSVPQARTTPVAAPAGRAPAGTATVVVYKTPTCGCCAAWVDRMREAGFTLEVHDMTDLRAEKQRLGVPLHMESCHTATVDGYALEGHVPPATVVRLLRERPEIAGVAVPGMPAGSPGMEMGNQRDPYDVVAWNADGDAHVYESH